MTPTFILVVIDLLYPESNLQFIKKEHKKSNHIYLLFFFSFFTFALPLQPDHASK